MTWLLFIASVLAVYAASLMVSKLTGPGGIFTKLRGAAKGSVKDGLKCPVCSGTWVSALLCGYLLYFARFPAVELPVWVFSVAGGNALLHLFDPL